MRRVGPLFGLAPLLFIALGVPACDLGGEPEHPIPSPAEVERLYEYDGQLSVSISGNVAQVSVVVDPAQYRRGGETWAKASLYIFLFSPATKAALDDYPGLGGVRVITTTPDGTPIAQALLPRGVLNDVTWRRALNMAGVARSEGTQRPGRMSDLIRWGEDRTQFEYNPDYISS